jgi:hypothetical protein
MTGSAFSFQILTVGFPLGIFGVVCVWLFFQRRRHPRS